MKQTLSREHRKILETTVAQARAEAGAEKALKALAVGAKDAPGPRATDAQKICAWRAHGRALGDDFLPSPSGRWAGGEGESSSREQAIDHLVTEIAYEHWHRMLFARFLAESDLLMHPDGYRALCRSGVCPSCLPEKIEDRHQDPTGRCKPDRRAPQTRPSGL